MTRVAAILLAAGRGARFSASGGEGPSKLVASLEGKPLVRYAAEAALASQARPLIVVTGHAEPDVRAALAGLDAAFTHNPDHAEGISTSLKAGLAALPSAIDGVLVLLADMPDVSAALLDALIRRFEERPDAAAIVPVSGGERGNPALLSRALFDRAALLSGDRGARKLIDEAGEAVIEVAADDGARRDIDTREALEQARKR